MKAFAKISDTALLLAIALIYTVAIVSVCAAHEECFSTPAGVGCADSALLSEIARCYDADPLGTGPGGWIDPPPKGCEAVRKSVSVPMPPAPGLRK